MSKYFKMFSISLLFFIFVFGGNALATNLYFNPDQRYYNIGETLIFDLMADIDKADAIMGFSFDLSFDNGITFVSGPGVSGTALTFNAFTPNASLGFEFWPVFDDGDTISGFLPIPPEDDLFGAGLKLGAFSFTAFAGGQEEIYLLTDPLDPFEGLIPGDVFRDGFMPNIPYALAVEHTPVPEPSMMLLLGTGIVGLAGFRKKLQR